MLFDNICLVLKKSVTIIANNLQRNLMKTNFITYFSITAYLILAQKKVVFEVKIKIFYFYFVFS